MNGKRPELVQIIVRGNRQYSVEIRVALSQFRIEEGRGITVKTVEPRHVNGHRRFRKYGLQYRGRVRTR